MNQSMINNSIVLICTAYRATNTLEVNKELNLKLKHNLTIFKNAQGVRQVATINEVTGCYKEEGQVVATEEASFIITVESVESAYTLAELVNTTYNQDACLLSVYGDTQLFFNDNSFQYLGKLKVVDVDTTELPECYTLLDENYLNEALITVEGE